jgi:hypothetical protein
LPLSNYNSKSNTFSAKLGGNCFPLAPYLVFGDIIESEGNDFFYSSGSLEGEALDFGAGD